jgi:hypothetical protein
VEGLGREASKAGSSKHLDEARKLLVVALSEFTLAAKEVGQAVSEEMCPR